MWRIASCAAASAAAYQVLCSTTGRSDVLCKTAPPSPVQLPSRSQHVQAAKHTEFDVVVVGGGATGAGTALDAAARGLTVALVERDDFASGTSSRSTKLVHGGVRYLEKAFKELDIEQFKLVSEALNERSRVLKIAPHLCTQRDILVPLYKWYMVPYMWAGLKMYDLVAALHFVGDLKWSHFISKSKVEQRFPSLQTAGLWAGVVYTDGQFDDAGMNVSLVLTAAAQGACVLNHSEVVKVLHNDANKVCGVEVVDQETGEKFEIKARAVVNATGPFVDTLRHLDSPSSSDLVVPSAGVHVVFPAELCPRDIGLLNPQTSDGRVLFLLPWEGRTLVGTTDGASELSFSPLPPEEAIQFVLDEMRHYLRPSVQLKRSDVLAAWSGLRPLIKDPNAKDTASLVRNHIILKSETGLITIAGGKWTTYRQMAQETVDAVVAAIGKTDAKKCTTQDLVLIGGENYTPEHYKTLMENHSIDMEVAQYFAHRYGTQADHVLKMAQDDGYRRLVDNHTFLEAEVVYACRQQYATTIADVLGRRLRLAFLDCKAAHSCILRVADIMQKELRWTRSKRNQQIAAAEAFLHTMGLPP
eukprot:m.53486 g.53486  ORF g.53486 m.53486 type:complete len:585 (-) comp15422_c0_seq1:23-1777(-)